MIKKPLALLVGLIILVLALAAGARMLPRLLGADDEAIAHVMPEGTAVFAEINLLNLQNAPSRQVAASFADTYTAVDIPFNSNDPSTVFNLFDPALHTLLGLTVSEDVRPWIGLNAGLGLLPPGEDGLAHWLLAATVRDDDQAAHFISKVATGSDVQGLFAHQPTADRVGDLVVIASDPATLAAAAAAQQGLSLADSKRYQQTLAQLPDNRAATLYLNGTDLDVFLETAVPATSSGYVQAARGLLPAYTAVGLAAYATADGIQVDMVGLHDELSATHQALRQAQTAETPTDAVLPGATTVYLTGQRLDLVWQLLKGSLAGLGYSAADVDEAMALFARLFGFNPETELLARLDGAYAVALVPTPEGAIDPGLSAVALAAHPDPAALTAQADALAAGLTPLGATATKEGDVYEITTAAGPPLAAYMVHENFLLVGTERAGLTAVVQSVTSLADKPLYQGAWAVLPANALPFLFIDGTQLAAWLPYLAAGSNPITHVVMGIHSNETVSRGTLIFVIR